MGRFGKQLTSFLTQGSTNVRFKLRQCTVICKPMFWIILLLRPQMTSAAKQTDSAIIIPNNKANYYIEVKLGPKQHKLTFLFSRLMTSE